MRPKTVMVVAGDPSGDANAADLVKSLALAIPDAQFQPTADMQPLTTPLAPRFFGAGGPKLAGAGVELAFNLTGDAVIGPGDALRKLALLKRRLDALARLALERQPDLIILVDFGAFNWRLARAIRGSVRARSGAFFNWRPAIVQYVSPQVWASRPGRADKMSKDLDLLLCLLPFEKEWYARRVPRFNVEWVGHPMIDHYARDPHWARRGATTDPPTIAILPGSRKAELERHLPVMLGAAHIISQKQRVQFKMVLDNDTLAAMAGEFQFPGMPRVDVQSGRLAEALASATLAITKTGTITLECAYFGVPAVAIYKTSLSTYLLARWLISGVKYLAMPNLLADQTIYPEFIQHRATAENIAASALDILMDPQRQKNIRAKLAAVIGSLGGPGATARATAAIVGLMGRAPIPDSGRPG
jgi:lipid-A-disaccharide synthase